MATAKQQQGPSPEQQFEEYMGVLERTGLTEMAKFIRKKSDGRVVLLPVAELFPGHDPRNQVSEENVIKLAGAFADNFMSVPPIIAELAEEDFADETGAVIPAGNYRIDEGRTRHRAAKKVELTEMRGIILEGVKELDRRHIAVEMNFQHGPVNLKFSELLKEATILMADKDDDLGNSVFGFGQSYAEVSDRWSRSVPSSVLKKVLHHAESNVKDRRLRRVRVIINKLALDKGAKMTTDEAITVARKKFPKLSEKTIRNYMGFSKKASGQDGPSSMEEELLDTIKGMPGEAAAAFKTAHKAINTVFDTLVKIYIEDGFGFDSKYSEATFVTAEKEARELLDKVITAKGKFKNHLLMGGMKTVFVDEEN